MKNLLGGNAKTVLLIFIKKEKQCKYGPSALE